jgi:hypothetical protein
MPKHLNNILFSREIRTVVPLRSVSMARSIISVEIVNFRGCKKNNN